MNQMVILLRFAFAIAGFLKVSSFVILKSSYSINKIKPKANTLYIDKNNNAIISTANVIPNINLNIQNIELSDELKSSFMSYAMSTILGRCLPDARDGLKPVHRRVLYAMHVLNLHPDSGYRKCARYVI